MATIIGSYLSPYVRKVLVCLELKGVPYDIDPIVPFYGDDEFTKLSPVRRIPVLIDGELAIPDSTVICEYLEDRYPEPSLYPNDPAMRAKARWLEEYADSRLGEVFIWRYFNQLVIKRSVWGEEKDTTVLKTTLEVDIPRILAYLESVLPENGFLFGEISLADIAIASFFRNISLARTKLDMAKFPRTASFVTRLLGLPSFSKLREFEDISIRTPIPKQRDTLRELGAPITPTTFFRPEPQRGVMSI
ncbi:MAG: glutathione S-transferase family protein [Gammaproteobacteria bacterium]|nr:glutathione S-transferase family protein [Gammaproteobacteria bacterium]